MAGIMISYIFHYGQLKEQDYKIISITTIEYYYIPKTVT